MLPVVYSMEGCKPCQQLKEWLDENNIAYDTGDPLKSGFRTVPVVKYRGETVVGFDLNKLKEVFPE